jgi:hypothetical protein
MKLKSGVGFDRDLGIAGRVMVKNNDGTVEHKLVHIDRPSKTTSPTNAFSGREHRAKPVI